MLRFKRGIHNSWIPRSSRRMTYRMDGLPWQSLVHHGDGGFEADPPYNSSHGRDSKVGRDRFDPAMIRQMWTSARHVYRLAGSRTDLPYFY